MRHTVVAHVVSEDPPTLKVEPGRILLHGAAYTLALDPDAAEYLVELLTIAIRQLREGPE